VYARLSALPAEASLLQRGALIASLSVGVAIVHLRSAGGVLGVASDVERALSAFAREDAPLATACFEQLDRHLAVLPGTIAVRASVLAITDALPQYAPFWTGRA